MTCQQFILHAISDLLNLLPGAVREGGQHNCSSTMNMLQGGEYMCERQILILSTVHRLKSERFLCPQSSFPVSKIITLVVISQ